MTSSWKRILLEWQRQFKSGMKENCTRRRECGHTQVPYWSFKRGLELKWSFYQVNACVVRQKSKTWRKLMEEYYNGGGERTQRSVAQNIIRGLLMVFSGLFQLIPEHRPNKFQDSRCRFPLPYSVLFSYPKKSTDYLQMVPSSYHRGIYSTYF